jgi:hypothetical protein
MKFEIVPYQKVGPIRFGMSYLEVRKSVWEPFESFKRTPKSVHPCDYFPSCQMFVYYTKNGIAEAVEFAEPAEVFLHDHNLLGLGFSELIEVLSKEDERLDIEADGFTSKGLGIGAYAPEAENDPTKPPESIIVFARGYYD